MEKIIVLGYKKSNGLFNFLNKKAKKRESLQLARSLAAFFCGGVAQFKVWTRLIKIIDFNRLIRIENAEFFRTIVRTLFKIEKTVDTLITHSYSPLSVIPPNRDPDCDEAQETHSGKAKKSDPQRNRNIKQSKTGKKRQEQHCSNNEFPTLQSFGCLLDKNSFIHGGTPSSHRRG